MKPILLLTVILFALNINAQPIGIAAGSISSSGIGGSFQHQFHQKFAIGYGAKYMNLKPVLTFKFNDVQVKTRIPEAFAQLEIFAKWFPRGYTGPNGFEKNRVFVRTGIAFRTNSTYNTHSKFKKTEIISDFIPPIVSTGVADIYVVTQKIQRSY